MSGLIVAGVSAQAGRKDRRMGPRDGAGFCAGLQGPLFSKETGKFNYREFPTVKSTTVPLLIPNRCAEVAQ